MRLGRCGILRSSEDDQAYTHVYAFHIQIAFEEEGHFFTFELKDGLSEEACDRQLSQYKRSRFFKVPNWNLKDGTRSPQQVPTFGIYRTGRSNAFERPARGSGRAVGSPVTQRKIKGIGGQE